MDQTEELKKYKNLYDSGAITEEEFAMLKQQLLGLKTDAEKEEELNARREKALAEIEELKAKTEAEKAGEEQKKKSLEAEEIIRAAKEKQAEAEETIRQLKEKQEAAQEAIRQAQEERAAAIKQAEEEQAAAIKLAEEEQAAAIKLAEEESVAVIKLAEERHTEAVRQAEAERTAAVKAAQAESLAAIEQEKLKGIEELKAQQEQYKQTYTEEKARQDAIAAATLEAQNKRQTARKETCRKAGHIIVLIISWIFAAFFLLLMIACFGLRCTGAGIACILLILILCPPLSDLLKKITWLEEHWWIKKIAIAVLVVLVFVLLVVASI